MVDFFRVLKSSAAGRVSALFAKAKSLFKAAPKAVLAGALSCIAVAAAFLVSHAFIGTVRTPPENTKTEYKSAAEDKTPRLFSAQTPAAETTIEIETETEKPPKDNLVRCYAIYINGTKIGTANARATLDYLLYKQAEEQAGEVFGEFESFKIKDEISFKYIPVSRPDPFLKLSIKFAKTRLNLNVSVIKEKSEPIGFSVLYIDSAELEYGRETIVKAGTDGVASNIYEVTYNLPAGTKLQEKLLESSTITPPVDKVIKRGIKLSKDSVPTNLKMFIMPYDGGITSEYGTRYLFGSTFHGGIDIAAKKTGDSCYGGYIKAAGDGRVVFAESYGLFGNLTIIEHKNGIRTYYAHQSKILVSVGDEVKTGDYIGRIGATGEVTGPHLHFEVRLPDGNGEYYRVDPKNFIINYESYYRK